MSFEPPSGSQFVNREELLTITNMWVRLCAGLCKCLWTHTKTFVIASLVTRTRSSCKHLVDASHREVREAIVMAHIDGRKQFCIPGWEKLWAID